jgi:hypothetical protein
MHCHRPARRVDDAEEGGDEGARRLGALVEEEVVVADARLLKVPRVVLGVVETQ